MTPYKIVKTFAEERDTSAPLNLPEFNKLRVKTINNGTGSYLVLETKRWALDEDNLAELFTQLTAMLKEANNETNRNRL